MEHDAEKWLPALNFEGVYEVSSYGRIRRIGGGRGAKLGRILRPGVNRKEEGYLYLFLYKNCRSTRYYVHRIVAGAFHGPRPEGHEVNHIDGDKQNCRADNLEWVTKKENARHAVSVLKRGIVGTFGSRHPGAKRYIAHPPCGKPIEVHGLNQFCKERGLDTPSMVNVANRRQRHHKGWRCEHAA